MFILTALVSGGTASHGRKTNWYQQECIKPVKLAREHVTNIDHEVQKYGKIAGTHALSPYVV